MIGRLKMRIDEIAAVRHAFARQAWKDAYAGFRTADEARAQLEAEDLERLAVCAYMVGKDEASADAWTRAHSEWLRLRDVRRAARCTFWLVLDLVTRGELAQARGWLARTQHLLEDAAGGCAEQGLLLVLTARLRIHEKDIEGAHDAAARAADLARRFDDSDLQVFSRLCVAQVVATRGDAAAATALFDEIMVAVTVGDVSPIGIGTVYCAVIEGCHALLDLGRARKWTEALSRWCETPRGLVVHRVARSVPSTGAAIRWYETSAESIPLPDDAFDVVLCQLGLQFVADKSAALREMRRGLAPGGRVLVTTPPPNAFFDALDEAMTRHVGSDAGAFVRMVFSLNDPAIIERLFQDAGFADVNVRTYAKDLRLPAARDFLWQYVHCTPLTGMLASLDGARIAALERDVVDRWAQWSDADGIKYEQRMNVARARK